MKREWPTPKKWRALGEAAVDRLMCDHIVGLRYGKIVHSSDPERADMLTFEYCPKCGTRLTARPA